MKSSRKHNQNSGMIDVDYDIFIKLITKSKNNYLRNYFQQNYSKMKAI